MNTDCIAGLKTCIEADCRHWCEENESCTWPAELKRRQTGIRAVRETTRMQLQGKAK